MEQLNFWQILLFSSGLCTCTVRSEKCVTVNATLPVSQGNGTCRIKSSETFTFQNPGKTFEERKCLFFLLGGSQLVSAALLKLVIYANIQTSELQVLMQRAAPKCYMEQNRSLKDSYHKKALYKLQAIWVKIVLFFFFYFLNSILDEYLILKERVSQQGKYATISWRWWIKLGTIVHWEM